jgi:uncharacterized spore protein YtfJ
MMEQKDQTAPLAAMLDRITAASSHAAVFGAPVESNGYTVITASEVAAGGGLGYGGGTTAGQQLEVPGGRDPQVTGGHGGGGGGGSLGRPVAVISIGPDGVKVAPIVDVTKVAIAGMTAWGAIAMFLARMARSSRR